MSPARGLIGTVAAIALVWGIDWVGSRVLNPYIYRVLVLCSINVILALSLNLVNGITGQFSIGHAGFMAVGAYASAAYTVYAVPLMLGAQGSAGGWVTAAAFLLAILVGGLASAVAGFLVGLPSMRLRGDYLAIVTLGFGEIIRVVILNIDAVGGARGFAGVPQRTSLAWVLGGAWLTFALIRNLMRSYHGRALLAIREDEIAAEALGVPTTRYKITAFVIGAFFAGMAGALFSHYTYLHTNSFTFMKSIEVIIMVVLGGMGSLTGSILGAILLTALPELLRFASAERLIIYSLLLILLMIARPQGILGRREVSFRAWFPRRRSRPTPAT
ncbi:MAG: branched-chain amino acid ABC transporter permease [Candidatus Eisenbacteria bacterium]|uniref:Branched-chain amino acid ABC transporter permease n=1 Tax=Eiseniibacteriota bacterium TaxID=2212470 RepID=A0A538T7R0_UNCEI|nr:MAG: branched-chain amino acid ABC transporter permease [Candidatus Eisenbacteria bacterium]